jgi:hypothetical protein
MFHLKGAATPPLFSPGSGHVSLTGLMVCSVDENAA